MEIMIGFFVFVLLSAAGAFIIRRQKSLNTRPEVRTSPLTKVNPGYARLFAKSPRRYRR